MLSLTSIPNVSLIANAVFVVFASSPPTCLVCCAIIPIAFPISSKDSPKLLLYMSIIASRMPAISVVLIPVDASSPFNAFFKSSAALTALTPIAVATVPAAKANPAPHLAAVAIPADNLAPSPSAFSVVRDILLLASVSSTNIDPNNLNISNSCHPLVFSLVEFS